MTKILKPTAFFRAFDFGKTPFWIAERSLKAILQSNFEEQFGARPMRIFAFFDPKRGIFTGGRVQEWETINSTALHRLQDEPLAGEQTVSHIKRIGRQIYNLCYDVIQRRGASFTRHGAESRIEHLLNMTEEIAFYGFSLVILDAPHKQFSSLLKNVVTEHVRERFLSRPPHEYIRVLLEPIEFSFAEQQQDELLILAQAVRRRPPIRKMIMMGGNPRDILNEMTQKYAPLARKLRRHIRHYSWIITSGGGIDEAATRLLTQLQPLLSAGYNLEKNAEEREQAIRTRHDQQRLLIRELGLTEEERQLFNLARDFSSSLRFWKEMLILLQSVICDLIRTHLKERDANELALLSGQELMWFLASGSFDQKTREQRRDGFVWLATQKSEEWLVGAKVTAWKRKELGR